MSDKIFIEGAKKHNLQNIDLAIPKHCIVVLTGISGSGKSSLAFDTLHAEGTRRYLRSFSSSGRQLANHMPPPEATRITGLPPTIALRQNPSPLRSDTNLAQSANIYDLLCVLYASHGKPHDPATGTALQRHSVADIADCLAKLAADSRVILLAPILLDDKNHAAELLPSLQRRGYTRAQINGENHELAELVENLASHFSSKKKNLQLDLVIDRLVIRPGIEKRLADSIEAVHAINPNHLIARIQTANKGKEKSPDREWQNRHFYRNYHNLATGLHLPDIRPEHFRPSTQIGACPACQGKGTLSKNNDRIPCPACHGNRIAIDHQHILLPQIPGNPGILQLCQHSIQKTHEIFKKLLAAKTIAHTELLSEIIDRLQLLDQLGLGHLPLDQKSHSLSTGEHQRLRLARQISYQLSGMLCILDEPSTGLHPHDIDLIIPIIRRLCQLGNTILLVEHHPQLIAAADYIIEIGPGAGSLGGKILSAKKNSPNKKTAAAKYPPLAKPAKNTPKKTTTETIKIPAHAIGTRTTPAIKIPLHQLAILSGRSGSGKTSILRAIATAFDPDKKADPFSKKPQPTDTAPAIILPPSIQRVIAINQQPAGSSRHSTPASYLGLIAPIRQIFHQTQQAKIRGFPPARFNYSQPSGQCHHCRGHGRIDTDIPLLGNHSEPCPACHGSRYNRETLSILYRGKNIAQILAMDSHTAQQFFANHPKISKPLTILNSIGLGYLPLGQHTASLSGGENQRLKLARHLARANPSTDNNANLLLFDYPCSGLHPLDTPPLITAMRLLIQSGNSIIAADNNAQLLAAADSITTLPF